jgi:bifunctional DNA-binding transcriptional regulator/antitoxin component of YhaV-PrlF toxin-antitoxin module
MTNSWTITVETDPESGDIILPLPTDLLEKYGWQEGDDLIWTNNTDGSWSLEKEKA